MSDNMGMRWKFVNGSRVSFVGAGPRFVSMSQVMDPTRFGMRVMDPGLKKLMDNLPKGDPDAQPPEEIEVSSGFCEQVATGIAGQICVYKLGRWMGPPMPLAEIIFQVRSLKTGRIEKRSLTAGWINQDGTPLVNAVPGAPMQLNVKFPSPGASG